MAEPAASMRVSAISIPMNDGQKLAADLYLPQQEGKYPCIVILTPYNKKHMTAALPERAEGKTIFDAGNYAYLAVDWRGYFGSKNAKTGKLMINPMKQVGKDGYDVVEWAAGQEWCNGKVGMWGASALGKSQFETALLQPPHLVCICPIVAGLGMTYEQYYHGGVLKYGHVAIMDKIGYPGTSKRLRKIPEYGRAWKFIERRTDCSALNIPILLIGCWFDTDMPGVLRTYRSLKTQAGEISRGSTKMLVGPWTHMGAAAAPVNVGQLKYPGAEGFSIDRARQFFDFYLREQKNNYDRYADFEYFQLQTGTWLATASWPPAGSVTEKLFLHGDGKLLPVAAGVEGSVITIKSNPEDPSPTVGGFNLPRRVAKYKLTDGPYDQSKDVESRDDCIAFSSDILPEAKNLQGECSVKLYVSSDQVDTDVTVRLCDVFPDGRSILVSDGVMRMRYRHGLENKQLMEKGRVYPVTIKLVTTAWTFKKGHSIRLLVSGSNYPRFDINPNNGEHFTSPQGNSHIANNSIYFSESYPSVLQLPVNSELTLPKKSR
ncbi:CocE/NonD family hydrolase [Planctomycetota bacterium]